MSQVKNFSNCHKNTLFFVLIVCDFFYGTTVGNIVGYFIPEAKILGMNDSTIDLFNGAVGIGGILSGIFYVPILKRVSKEYVFLFCVIWISLCNVGLGLIVYVQYLFSGYWILSFAVFGILISFGLARSGIYNFAISYAAEAYPETFARKMSITLGVLQLGVFVGPLEGIFFFDLFGYPGPFISGAVILMAMAFVGFSLSPNYPPSLQFEKSFNVENKQEEVKITASSIIFDPVVLTYLIFFLFSSSMARLVAQGFSIYLVETFEVSQNDIPILTNGPFLFSGLAIAMNYVLLKWFTPFFLSIAESILCIGGCTLLFIGGMKEEKSLVVCIIAYCMVLAGCQLSSFSGQIILEQAKKHLKIEANASLRDRVSNISVSTIFLSWIVASGLLSFLTLFFQFPVSLFTSGIVLLFTMIMFICFWYFNKEKKKENDTPYAEMS